MVMCIHDLLTLCMLVENACLALLIIEHTHIKDQFGLLLSLPAACCWRSCCCLLLLLIAAAYCCCMLLLAAGCWLLAAVFWLLAAAAAATAVAAALLLFHPSCRTSYVIWLALHDA